MTQLYSNILTNGADPGIAGSGVRASYSLIGFNTNQGSGGAYLMNPQFQPVLAQGYLSDISYYTAPNNIYLNNGTLQNGQSMFFDGNATYTQSYPSSGSGYYISGTVSSGQFGNASIDVFSNGVLGRASRGAGGWNNKYYLNAYAISSNHTNRRNVYLQYGAEVKCVDLLYGMYWQNKPNTFGFDTAINNSMSGSASYHLARKEYVVVGWVSGSNFIVKKYSNVDLDTYPDPAQAFTRPEVTVDTSYFDYSAAYLGSMNDEPRYNIKAVITDNGKVYLSVFWPSDRQCLYSFTPGTGGTNITLTLETSQGTTTSYGRDQGFPYYGQRQITSRDGTATCIFCPYYYYNSGIRAFIVDRSNNTYTYHGYSDTNYGTQVIPFGDSGFGFSYSGNHYANNWTGAYISSIYDRNYDSGSGTNAIVSIGSSYYSGAIYPNTTNYPGITQVTDYDVLPKSNMTGPLR